MRILTLFIALSSFCVSAQLDSNAFEMDGVPVPHNQGWGWYDLANRRMSDSLFFQDFLRPQNADASLFVLKNDSLWGALDGGGWEILPFEFDSILVINGHFLTQKAGVWSYTQWFYSEGGRDSKEVTQEVTQVIQFDSLFSDGANIYIYSNGKTGLITPSGALFQPIYASIHPITDNNKLFNREEFGYYMVLDGKQFNLLDEAGKALLPSNVWDLRSAQTGIFEFRRGEQPEYYSMYSNEIITPNGRDIVFYGAIGYKMYTESKSKGVLHRYDLPILDDYDDYFVLIPDVSQESEYLAVRKNGKVGLLKNGMLQGSMKYDQINTIESRSDGMAEPLFLCFIGDSCGLLDNRGIERFAPKYANIIGTSDADRYIVLDRRLSGVVDGSGKTIIPLQYDHIWYDNKSRLFTVQHNRKIGLFRRDGSVLIPIEYDKHRICSRTYTDFYNDGESGVHVLGKNDDLYFANSLGLIDGIAYNHYDYTAGVLKAYKKNGITVFAISDRGLVEEVVNYPLFNSAVVEKDYWAFEPVYHGWAKSYVEENQAEGYFGLRLYSERGFGVPPRYRTIRVTAFENAMGEVAYQSTSIPFLNEVPMTVIRSYDEMNVGTGSISCSKIYNTEMLMNEDGSSDRRLNYMVTGTQMFSASGYSSSVDMSDGVLFADYQGERSEYRRFFIGGQAEICPIEEADVSLYDYYVYWNLADACRLENEWMTQVLDPKMGVRFVNSKRALINTFSRYWYVGVRSFPTEEDFKSLNFVNPIVYFEQKMGVPFGELKRNVVKSGVEQPIIKDCLSARSIELGYGQVVEAEIKSSDLAKIHVEYPNYLFRPNDRDLSYDAGRITRQIDSNWVQLISPNNELIWDSCLMIRYVNEKRFAVRTLEGWRLIDRDGKLINDAVFRAVNVFENNQAVFELMDRSALVLNADGEMVQQLPELPVKIGENYFCLRGNPSEIFENRTGKSDVVLADEKFLEGFFIKKMDGKTSVRRFGSTSNIELEPPSALKSFGNRLYFTEKETVVSIDTLLASKKYKKIKSFRVVSPEIGWLEGKRDVLIDQNWTVVHTLSKNERFELRSGDLVILEKDSVLLTFASKTANGSSLAKKPTIQVDSLQTESTPLVEVVYRDGKFGAMRDDVSILPFDFTSLAKLNDEEFFASLGSEIQIFNSELERIGDAPFDFFFQTDYGNYIFYSDTGQWSAFTADLEKIR